MGWFNFWSFAIGLAVGAFGYASCQRYCLGEKPGKGVAKVKSETKIVYETEGEAHKKENLAKILATLSKKEDGKITNDEVEKLLGVSNTTAERYLNELDRAGKLKQVGATGVGVYYKKP